MENKEYLNEASYQKNKNKLKMVALIILIIGVLGGGSLIFKGISNSKKANDTYTEENKQTKIYNLNNQINAEKAVLEAKKAELQSKGVVSSSKYDSGEAYDLYIVTNALDPSFSHCSFDEYKNNTLTSKYCSLKNEIKDAERTNVGFEKKFNSFGSIPYYMIGAFIIIASCMFAGAIFVFAKRREILAFQAQQVMPVAQEGIEKIAPTLGKAGASIAKEMTPVYGEAAKEIAKGIKEGLNEADKKE